MTIRGNQIKEIVGKTQQGLQDEFHGIIFRTSKPRFLAQIACGQRIFMAPFVGWEDVWESTYMSAVLEMRTST